MLGTAAFPPTLDQPQHMLVVSGPRAHRLSPHVMPSPVAAAGGGRGKRGFGTALPAQAGAGGIMELPER